MNIAGYYAALLPFFFLSGLYISLCFVLNDEDVGRVYGFDLTGAGTGALAVLGLMWVVHPFRLVPCLLLPLALAAGFAPLLAGPGGGAGGAGAGRRGGAAAAGRSGRNQRFQGDLCAFPRAGQPRGGADHARRAAFMSCSTTSPSGLTPTFPTMPACSACPDRRRASVFTATATGWRRFPKGRCRPAMPPPRWARCPMCCIRTRGCCWWAPPGGSASPRRRRSAPPKFWRLSPNRCCSARCGTVLLTSPAYAASDRVRLSRAGPIAATRIGGAWDVIDISADFLDCGGGQCQRLRRRGDRPVSARPGAGRGGFHPGLHPRVPRLCRAHAGDRARRPADQRHRRPAGACAGHPLGLERPHPGVEPALRRGPDRRR